MVKGRKEEAPRYCIDKWYGRLFTDLTDAERLAYIATGNKKSYGKELRP